MMIDDLPEIYFDGEASIRLLPPAQVKEAYEMKHECEEFVKSK